MAASAVAATSTVKTSTAVKSAAAPMPNYRAATVIELSMMAVVVMSFPRMVNVEVGIIVIAISPTI